MGPLRLEGWRRRPQGKGCLLLAVAGTTSLVTLLLAVPITVLAVLVVVPQKQGLVSEWLQSVSRGLEGAHVPLPPAMPGVSRITYSTGLAVPGRDFGLPLCWFSFHIPVMLLCPDVSKPLLGCLFVSFLFPRHTQTSVSLPKHICLACLPFQGDGWVGRLDLHWEWWGWHQLRLNSGYCDPTHPGNRDH